MWCTDIQVSKTLIHINKKIKFSQDLSIFILCVFVIMYTYLLCVLINLYCMCMSFASSMSESHLYITQGDQKRATDSLKPNYNFLLAILWVLGFELAYVDRALGSRL